MAVVTITFTDDDEDHVDVKLESNPAIPGRLDGATLAQLMGLEALSDLADASDEVELEGIE